MPARGPGRGQVGDPHGEAAVGERAEGVVAVGAGEHVARLLRPRQRLGRGDAAVHLQHAALEHPVLGPGARVVLHAGDLDPGPVASGGDASHPVAVRVAGEVADDPRMAGDDRDEPLGVVGVDPEVVVGPRARVGVPHVVVPEREHRPVGLGGEVFEPLELLSRHLPRGVAGDRGVEQRQRDARRHRCAAVPRGHRSGSGRRRGCRARGGVGRRRPGRRRRGTRRTPRRAVAGEVALHEHASGSSAAISSIAPRFMTSGYGSAPARR